MKKMKSFVIPLGIFLCAALVWLTSGAAVSVAAPPPADATVEWVYRYDTRPPEVVFRDGFLPWGRNDDFTEYLLDNTGILNLQFLRRLGSDPQSIADHFANVGMGFGATSAYISTTTANQSSNDPVSANAARQILFAIRQTSLRMSPGNTASVYLYQIRANSETYQKLQKL